MSSLEPSSLVIAIRVYPDTKKPEEHKRRGRWKLPNTIFVWDTETRTDRTQRLTFGSYRLVDAATGKGRSLSCRIGLAADRCTKRMPGFDRKRGDGRH
jgi:hypothetical protein